VRDLKNELELMNEKNPPMRTSFDYRDMVERCLIAETECDNLRNLRSCKNCKWNDPWCSKRGGNLDGCWKPEMKD